MQEIVPNLWLCTPARLATVPACDRDLIINCTPDVRYLRPCARILRLSGPDMSLYFSLACPMMHGALCAGHRVIVHDSADTHTGRAAAVVAAYLTRYGDCYE